MWAPPKGMAGQQATNRYGTRPGFRRCCAGQPRPERASACETLKPPEIHLGHLSRGPVVVLAQIKGFVSWVGSRRLDLPGTRLPCVQMIASRRLLERCRPGAWPDRGSTGRTGAHRRAPRSETPPGPPVGCRGPGPAGGSPRPARADPGDDARPARGRPVRRHAGAGEPWSPGRHQAAPGPGQRPPHHATIPGGRPRPAPPGNPLAPQLRDCPE